MHYLCPALSNCCATIAAVLKLLREGDLQVVNISGQVRVYEWCQGMSGVRGRVVKLLREGDLQVVNI